MDKSLYRIVLAPHTSYVRCAANAMLLAVLAALGACSAEDLPSVTSSAMAASTHTAQAIAADKRVVITRKQAERDALKRANAAYQRDRIVSPAGDNALEHALHARQANANSPGATELLTDIMPMVTSQVQSMITQGRLDEAARVITLLQQAHPDSLTTVTLNRQLGNAIRSTPIAALASPTR